MARLSVTTNELLEAIQAAREPERSDAMTTKEIMAALSLSKDQVQHLLAKVGAKRVTVTRKSVDGRLVPVPAYVLK